MKIDKFLIAVLIIIIAASFRLLPHLPNFTPIAAMALFGAVHLPRKYAVLLPVASMFISDFFIGAHSTMLYVYGSFLLIVLVGFYIREKAKPRNIFIASLVSSLLFFFITNFGVWLTTSMYPKTISGLIEAYFMGLPFLRNTMLGDLFYVGMFFGGFEIVKKYILEKRLLPQK